MEKRISVKKEFSLPRVWNLVRPFSDVICGSLFLSLLALAKVQIGIIPVTLQTLAVFLLAVFQGGKKAALSTLLYLGYATLGYPVISGGVSNPLWMFGPTAGYLIGCVFAAFVIGTLYNKVVHKTFLKTLSCVFIGQLIIYAFGVGVLGFAFVGFPKAFMVGLVPFIASAAIKMTLTASTAQLYSKAKCYLSK